MMQSFVQYTPTKVVFGKDTQKEAGKLVSELGITKVISCIWRWKCYKKWASR